MNDPVSSQETYSTVISNMGGQLSPDAIKNRIFLTDLEGRPKTSSASHPFATYATAEHFQSKEGIQNHPTLVFATPRHIYEGLTESHRELCNILKTFVNARPTAWFWHHGTTDDNCKFYDLHIHLVIKCPTKLSQVSQCKVMKKVVAKYGVEFRCQKVQHLEGLLNHLQQEP